ALKRYSSATTRFNLALALLRIGDVERAQKEYESASSQADENALKSDGINGLSSALVEDPMLPGAEEILQMLAEKLNDFTRKRSETIANRLSQSADTYSLQFRAALSAQEAVGMVKGVEPGAGGDALELERLSRTSRDLLSDHGEAWSRSTED